VELYIDTPDGERNKAIFDFLAQHKENIERAFGTALTWQRLEERRAARICYTSAVAAASARAQTGMIYRNL
jgi:hypothetical protein